MGEELLPCPQGCDVARISTIHGGLGISMRCHCGWEGPAMPTKEEAIRAWNTRPDSKPYKYADFDEYWLIMNGAFQNSRDLALGKRASMYAFKAAREHKEG